MRLCFILTSLLLFTWPTYSSQYERNKAVPVEKVLFGKVDSVRNITERELIEDHQSGWSTFGGAIIGGAIGHQFGSGSGQDVATILGALIGASIARDKKKRHREVTIELVELMITVNNGDQFMVLQQKDRQMLFKAGDEIRMIYLSDGAVRIDKIM